MIWQRTDTLAHTSGMIVKYMNDEKRQEEGLIDGRESCIGNIVI